MKQTKTEHQYRIQKDIKKRMDRYQDKMKSALGEEESSPPASDSTRSEE